MVAGEVTSVIAGEVISDILQSRKVGEETRQQNSLDKTSCFFNSNQRCDKVKKSLLVKAPRFFSLNQLFEKLKRCKKIKNSLKSNTAPSNGQLLYFYLENSNWLKRVTSCSSNIENQWLNKNDFDLLSCIMTLKQKWIFEGNSGFFLPPSLSTVVKSVQKIKISPFGDQTHKNDAFHLLNKKCPSNTMGLLS